MYLVDATGAYILNRNYFVKLYSKNSTSVENVNSSVEQGFTETYNFIMKFILEHFFLVLLASLSEAGKYKDNISLFQLF